MKTYVFFFFWFFLEEQREGAKRCLNKKTKR